MRARAQGLVGFGQEHPVREMRVEPRPQKLDDVVGLRKSLAGGVLALDQIRHGVDLNPSTPSPSQNFITFHISSRTAGLS